ncbi:hypothetical protein TNIN_406991 [Trichonephila inaurata madagascariensis]|uniref:Uncharacterized protein n=1 Tax=Trichonephila inaurata madagascariensis TaxID=2747483 RepID=A0A8X6X6Z3_9ARAC|nr:hypothetical protein TNIN_406991 [Trichonephila inaurata madagascariensis]
MALFPDFPPNIVLEVRRLMRFAHKTDFDVVMNSCFRCFSPIHHTEEANLDVSLPGFRGLGYVREYFRPVTRPWNFFMGYVV